LESGYNSSEEEVKGPKVYKSKYAFKLIDFGIMSKFKVKNLNRQYESHVGNLFLAAHRQLRCKSARFQDDFESLAFIVHTMIPGQLPFETEFQKLIKPPSRVNGCNNFPNCE
jgi:hypothetical protein